MDSLAENVVPRNHLAPITVDLLRTIRIVKTSNEALREALQVSVAMLAERDRELDVSRRSHQSLVDENRRLRASMDVAA